MIRRSDPETAKVVEGSYGAQDPERDRIWVFDAQTLLDAGKKAAVRAHEEYAWESSWPLNFRITRPDGRVFMLEIDREVRPEFVTLDCEEVVT
jgi:hypothetical protein